ncbi:conserved hypothetical protein [Oceanicaulis sp. 350]|uniref:hypothetical protein n=1 Tax=Oceanicaulis alexandrii TaxID=153233 RepID=UPI0012F39DC5|nr:hypothetical protein [Oceanicaulis alexandrii]VXC45361.1 conserved hypothetical protein [Oceanicaulis sp. 350]
MTQYWFARRRAEDIGKPAFKGRFYPIVWQGWAVVGVFLGAMALGVLLLFESARLGAGLVMSLIPFIMLTAFGVGTLMLATVSKGDPNRTVAQYRAGDVERGREHG